jgi:hypothetical protein
MSIFHDFSALALSRPMVNTWLKMGKINSILEFEIVIETS